MNHHDSSRKAASEYNAAGDSTRRERLRIALTGAFVASLVSVGMIAAGTALGGSGGVGSGGGGGDNGGTASKYERIWNDFSSKDKKWAHQTSECESGQNARIHDGSGTYHGAFQFMKSTWQSAPQSVGADPHTQSWKTQAVVSVLMKHRDGRGAWPVCG
jgi:hypothetical protein